MLAILKVFTEVIRAKCKFKPKWSLYINLKVYIFIFSYSKQFYEK